MGRRARLAEFGADLALDPNDPDWVERARAATDGKGIDLAIDQISGGTINGTMQAAAIRGRVINVGRLGGLTGDFDLHALKRIEYTGVTFRTRTVEEVRALNTRMRADLWEAAAVAASGARSGHGRLVERRRKRPVTARRTGC